MFCTIKSGVIPAFCIIFVFDNQVIVLYLKISEC